MRIIQNEHYKKKTPRLIWFSCDLNEDIESGFITFQEIKNLTGRFSNVIVIIKIFGISENGKIIKYEEMN